MKHLYEGEYDDSDDDSNNDNDSVEFMEAHMSILILIIIISHHLFVKEPADVTVRPWLPLNPKDS